MKQEKVLKDPANLKNLKNNFAKYRNMRMMDLIYGKTPSDTIIDFLRFTCKNLGLDSIPKITLVDNKISNDQSNSFAAYSPNKKTIVLFVKHRHIMDVLRSLCHEMVHYRQDLQGELGPKSGMTGSDHENEANAVAGQIMRKYGKIHPELFS